MRGLRSPVPDSLRQGNRQLAPAGDRLRELLGRLHDAVPVDAVFTRLIATPRRCRVRRPPARPRQPSATLSVYAHLTGEAASIGRAREYVNGQFANLTTDAS